MKKILFSIVVCLASCAVIAFSAAPVRNEYPQTLIISDISGDTVTGSTMTEISYSFTGAEDWQPGDICAVIMCDNGTPASIYDDIILECKYCGNIDR